MALVEMGHTHSTVVILRVSEEGPIKLATGYDSELGALHFDIKLFDHYAKTFKANGSVESMIEPGSKRGLRLLTGCERIRKLLSQLGESQVGQSVSQSVSQSVNHT